VERIVVHSMAHRGDVYPYVPIASELCGRGHEVSYVVRVPPHVRRRALLPLYFGRITVSHLDALFEADDAELAHANQLVWHPATSITGSMSQ